MNNYDDLDDEIRKPDKTFNEQMIPDFYGGQESPFGIPDDIIQMSIRQENRRKTFEEELEEALLQSLQESMQESMHESIQNTYPERNEPEWSGTEPEETKPKEPKSIEKEAQYKETNLRERLLREREIELREKKQKQEEAEQREREENEAQKREAEQREKELRETKTKDLLMRVERLHLFSNKEEEKNCIQTLLRIIENYRNNTKETTKVDATEHEGIKKIMDELYTFPVTKGKKPAITEEIFTTIMELV
jgi:hypothetical protein